MNIMSPFRTRMFTAAATAATVFAALAITAGCSTEDSGEPQPVGENSESMTSPDAAPDTAETTESEPSENTGESEPETQPDTEAETSPTGEESEESVAPAEPTGPQPCTAADIELSLGEGDGAMGSVYYPLTFTNTGADDCTLEGFPGVSYVAYGDGTQLGDSAAWEGPEAGAVTVAPGDSASVTLREVNVHFFDESDCDPTDADGLRVYVPGETNSLYIEQEFAEGCAIDPLPGDQVQLSVTAFGTDE